MCYRIVRASSRGARQCLFAFPLPSWSEPPLLVFQPSTSIDHFGPRKLLLTQHGSPKIALLSASLPTMPNASSPSSGTRAASRRKKLAAASKAKPGARAALQRAHLAKEAVGRYRETDEFIQRTSAALSSMMHAMDGVTAAIKGVGAAQVLALQPPRIHGASTRAARQRKGRHSAGESFSKSSSSLRKQLTQEAARSSFLCAPLSRRRRRLYNSQASQELRLALNRDQSCYVKRAQRSSRCCSPATLANTALRWALHRQ